MLTNVFFLLSIIIIASLSIGLLFKRKEIALIGWLIMMISGIIVASDGLYIPTGEITYDANTITPITSEVPLSKTLIAPSMIIGGISGLLFTISNLIKDKNEKTYGKKAFEGY